MDLYGPHPLRSLLTLMASYWSVSLSTPVKEGSKEGTQFLSNVAAVHIEPMGDIETMCFGKIEQLSAVSVG